MFLRHVFGAGGYGYPGGYPGTYGPYAQWYPWVHLVGMGIFLLIVVIVAVLAWRKFNHRLQSQPQPVPRSEAHPALEILQMRLAKGEITSEEYQRIKADLVS
ncbi:MAG: SHOCT domain-containing protein [Desulfitobacteriaceae bacterium]|nr:SHOCT domain-containing protein [Desulfitobacteriaceae bacterium]MDI6913797.1 SHOCT domain-containing protein [Desulfitobacteriaceae bacterium]